MMQIESKLAEINIRLKQLDAAVRTIKTLDTEYLKNDQLASVLDVSLGTINKWRQSGKLPAYKIDGLIYFKWSDVVVFLEAHKETKGLASYRKTAIRDYSRRP